MRRPPRFAAALLRMFAPEVIVGDLEEEYRSGRSMFWLWRQVVTTALIASGRGIRAKLQILCPAHSSDDDRVPLISRRAVVRLGWIAFAASMAATLALTGRFMFPNVVNEPTAYVDRSGLQFHPTPNGLFRITSVVPGSPGDRAELQRDDVLLQIDQKDAKQLSLADMRNLLSQSRESLHILRLDRGGHTRMAALLLKSTN